MREKNALEFIKNALNLKRPPMAGVTVTIKTIYKHTSLQLQLIKVWAKRNI